MRQQQDEPGRFSICSRQAAVVPEDSFFSKGLGQNSDSNLLIKKLDEIATYIVEHFLSKTPN
ncbi:hypothetical protein DPV19_25350 [Escherichia coli]|nr:hypothetical protein [Escherichia coli]